MPTPQFDPEDILECARSIRPYLPELLDADTDEAFDQQLSDLLAQAKAGQSVDQQILAFVTSKPKTRQWAAEFLSPARIVKGFQRPPGISQTSSAKKYICPEGSDYIWYRRSIAIPIQRCPTHKVLLVPANEG